VAETQQRRITRRWPKFVNGSRYPAFCWASPFARVFKESTLEQPSNTGLAVVALGASEDDIAHVRFGQTAPSAIAQTLGQMVTGELGSNSLNKEAFTEAYERLTTSPGVGTVDVLIMSLHDNPADNGIIHFGSRETGDLSAPLGSLTEQLMAEAGVTLPLITQSAMSHAA
jgi:hypothetical protein